MDEGLNLKDGLDPEEPAQPHSEDAAQNGPHTTPDAPVQADFAEADGIDDGPDGFAIVRLRPVLNVTSAMATARQFLELRGRNIRVDASQVQHLGGQTVQILLSACRSWAEDGNAFAIAECSEKFIDDLKLFGFAPHQFTAVETLP